MLNIINAIIVIIMIFIPYFFFPQNAHIRTIIHKAIVQPPKRFIKNITNVAAEFLPDAMIVGKK